MNALVERYYTVGGKYPQHPQIPIGLTSWLTQQNQHKMYSIPITRPENPSCGWGVNILLNQRGRWDYREIQGISWLAFTSSLPALAQGDAAGI